MIAICALHLVDRERYTSALVTRDHQTLLDDTACLRRGCFLQCEHSAERDADQEFTAHIDQSKYGYVAPVWQRMNRPLLGYLVEYRRREGKPFGSNSKDDDRMGVLFLKLLYLCEMAGRVCNTFGRQIAIEQSQSCRRISRAIAAMGVLLEFRATAIAMDPDPVPAIVNR